MTNPTQLTIEHLAAYLPYGVKVKSIDIFIGDPVFTLGVETISGTHAGMNWVLSDSFKPILRPLSQLTVPITHNGETFEPLYELGDRRADERMGYNDHYIDYINTENSGKGIDWLNEPWFIVQYLLEWHFDVFGLIEAGLAVSMNPDGTI